MLTYERNGKTYQLDEEALPETAISYLLQYGFAQSLQDSIAGRAKAVREEYEAAAKENNETVNPADLARAIESDLDGQLSKRLDAIRTGSVGSRVGTPKDPFKAMCLRVAREMLSAALKAANTKMPKDKEKVAELVATLIERNRAKVETEAKRRMEASPEIDLDGIL